MNEQVTKEELFQVLWDIYGILGFDTDGEKTYHASLAGARSEKVFCQQMIKAAREFRRDYDDCLEELPDVAHND